jgi:hypothetical protein
MIPDEMPGEMAAVGELARARLKYAGTIQLPLLTSASDRPVPDDYAAAPMSFSNAPCSISRT